MRALLWVTRILCLAMFLFAAPFFVGYGVPDFAAMAWYDLVSITQAAIALVALLMAWRWTLLAGWILTASGVLTSFVGLAAGFEPYSPLSFCLVPGLLLLLHARLYEKSQRRSTL
jgi:hypothetical protein